MFKAIIFLTLILASYSYAAEISGKVYDFDLNLAKNAVVEVNSTPIQRYVAKNGGYSFNVEEGMYTITAKYNGYSDKADIVVKKDGKYVYDFILFPSTDDELPEDYDIDVSLFEENGFKKYYLYIILVVVLISFSLFIYWKRNLFVNLFSKKKAIEKKEETGKEDLDKVINIIKESNGRIVQKELREKVNLSEAKVSLMITELEHRGLVQRIKKGRGNIIILR